MICSRQGSARRHLQAHAQSLENPTSPVEGSADHSSIWHIQRHGAEWAFTATCPKSSGCSGNRNEPQRESAQYFSSASSSAPSNCSTKVKNLEEELLLRKTRFGKAWEDATLLMQSNPEMLPHFDSLLQQFSSALKRTHARQQGAGDVVGASQLEPIDTGFGRSLCRVKPLLERKSRRKTTRKENLPPLASTLQAVGKTKGRQTFKEILSQGGASQG